MKLVLTLLISIMLLNILVAQTQQDTIYTLYASQPVIIDGSDTDDSWSKTDWHAIDQVWIPYNASMVEGDFEGRYKAAWDADYLYLLVEVSDNMLSDDHSDPLQNWWDDDCLELFIDEDRSKGNHEKNNNAFAYHVSLSYDAIDMSSSGAGVNYKDNMTVVMDTIGDDLYLWEFAVKMYNKNFSRTDTEASRVKLVPNKLMGFSIAYCDNDETNSRENFIGSMYMTSSHANDNYITADYLGSMLLTDPENKWVSIKELDRQDKMFSLFPTVVTDYLTISRKIRSFDECNIEIIDLSGNVVDDRSIIGQQKTVDLSRLINGLYFVHIWNSNFSQLEKVVKI